MKLHRGDKINPAWTNKDNFYLKQQNLDPLNIKHQQSVDECQKKGGDPEVE